MPRLSWFSKWGCSHSNKDKDKAPKSNLTMMKAASMHAPLPCAVSRTCQLSDNDKKVESYHHPNNHHAVALKSSTYGILKMDPVKDANTGNGKSCSGKPMATDFCFNPHPSSRAFSGTAAKKPPKGDTANMNGYPRSRRLASFAFSSGEEPPETINTWELMEGLEDSDSLSFDPKPKPSSWSRQDNRWSYDRSFTFHAPSNPRHNGYSYSPGTDAVEDNSKPVTRFKHSEDFISKGSREHDLKAQAPRKPRDEASAETEEGGSPRLKPGSIQQMVNAFQQLIDERTAGSQSRRHALSCKSSRFSTRSPPGGENKIVLYVTSLRGIRKTFEDCRSVKLILQGFRIVVDERDISMHAQFKKEVQDILGKNVTLPRLFVAGKYVGGVDEIQQMHEIGELAKLLEGFPRLKTVKPCDACADVRFLPCPQCDGSCKIPSVSEEVFWIRCTHCNENGLVRCPLCCTQ
eukprot:TRINITY_DN15867_c0_g1_i1.p1 TRINITY_DN15867_c0_g1~~TRINITY_DN15867_c0_g1_i1.p1  ORF type:complete len:461 (+),score=45.79 TRINITY_DN15867_c0_g1_i1:488-1870(+)